MIFNTHDRTPKIKRNKILKITTIYCCIFVAAFFLFLAIATSITSQSILPAVIILIPIAFISALVIVHMNDMNKAYVQIDEDHITVADYYFFRKRKMLQAL